MTPKQKERQEKSKIACLIVYQKRIEDYNLNPKKCLNCNACIEYKKRNNKFCSHSCSAAVNNKGTVRNFVNGKYSSDYIKPLIKKIIRKNLISCLYCGVLTANIKFCNANCREENRLKEIKNGINQTGIILGNSNTIKRRLKEIKGEKCEICGIVEWQGQKAPLVLDHINGIPLDNRLINLRLVCGNCNMQLPTFAGRNVGKGGGN